MRLLLLSLLIFVPTYLIRFYTVRPSFKEGQRVRITGQISEEPLVVEGRQRLLVGGVRVYLDRFPEYHYGDRVVAEGEMAKGRSGWYLKHPNVEKLVAGGPLHSLRQKTLELYGKYLPEPHSALLSGIVLGTKTGLDAEFFSGLRKTGTLHVVVASGMNISLFAGGILGALAYFVGRKRAIIPALLGVLVYVILVGFQPPIVRAAVMGSIAFAALAWGREFDAWRALFISAGLLLLLNPLWVFDVGFQLSFAATAGMLAFTPYFANFLEVIITRSRYLLVLNWIRGDLSVTLGAQLAVAPILLLSFGQISFISPLTNALILWTIPFIMAGGMIIAGLGFLWEPLGQVGAWFVWILLEYFVKVVEIFDA